MNAIWSSVNGSPASWASAMAFRVRRRLARLSKKVFAAVATALGGASAAMTCLPLAAKSISLPKNAGFGLDQRVGERAGHAGRVALLHVEDRVVAQLRPRGELGIEQAAAPRLRRRHRKGAALPAGSGCQCRSAPNHRLYRFLPQKSSPCASTSTRIDASAGAYAKVSRSDCIMDAGLVVAEHRECHVERVGSIRIRPVGMADPVIDHVREDVRVDNVALAEQQERARQRQRLVVHAAHHHGAGDALRAEIAGDQRIGDRRVVEGLYRCQVGGAQPGQQRRKLRRLHAVRFADEGVEAVVIACQRAWLSASSSVVRPSAPSNCRR